MPKLMLILTIAMTLFVLHAQRETPSPDAPAVAARPTPPPELTIPKMPARPEVGSAIETKPAPQPTEELIAPIRHQDEEAFVDRALGMLDRIAENPEAAPLLEEIVHFLQSDPSGGVRFNDLPVDENGVYTMADDVHERLFPDPEIRQKWLKLMEIIAADADLYAGLTEP